MEKVGPVLNKVGRTKLKADYHPPASKPSSKLTSSNPSRPSASSCVCALSITVGDSGITTLSYDFKKRMKGCSLEEVVIGFSRKVADIVRHRRGSVKVSRRNAEKLALLSSSNEKLSERTDSQSKAINGYPYFLALGPDKGEIFMGAIRGILTPDVREKQCSLGGDVFPIVVSCGRSGMGGGWGKD